MSASIATTVYENTTKSSTTANTHDKGTVNQHLHVHLTFTPYSITCLFYHHMNHIILFMNSAIKSLSIGAAAAIALCCSAVVVGVMIAAIILLTVVVILKKKQLQAMQISNSGHIQEESSSITTGQQTQAMFHCAQTDEVSSIV